MPSYLHNTMQTELDIKTTTTSLLILYQAYEMHSLINLPATKAVKFSTKVIEIYYTDFRTSSIFMNYILSSALITGLHIVFCLGLCIKLYVVLEFYRDFKLLRSSTLVFNVSMSYRL